jgi:hypothetical protein
MLFFNRQRADVTKKERFKSPKSAMREYLRKKRVFQLTSLSVLFCKIFTNLYRQALCQQNVYLAKTIIRTKHQFKSILVKSSFFDLFDQA